MDEKFQDRIDNYLLNRMDDTEKSEFLREVEQDKEKKEQLEFTQIVKDSICSREEKMQALKQFQRQYEKGRRTDAYRATGTDCAVCYCPSPEVSTTEPVQPKKKKWLWISGAAAVLLVGFFAIKPMFDYELSPNYNGESMEQMRGGDEVFSPTPTFSGRPIKQGGDEAARPILMDSINKDTVKSKTVKQVESNE